jgi:hypothetical protein
METGECSALETWRRTWIVSGFAVDVYPKLGKPASATQPPGTPSQHPCAQAVASKGMRNPGKGVEGVEVFLSFYRSRCPA